MGKGGIVFYFWGADATEKGSLGPSTVVNSNQIKILDVAPWGVAEKQVDF